MVMESLRFRLFAGQQARISVAIWLAKSDRETSSGPSVGEGAGVDFEGLVAFRKITVPLDVS